MKANKLLQALEECETAIENFRMNISILSDISLSIRESREETFNRMRQTVERIDRSRELLASVEKLRQNSHEADVQISRFGELVSVESILSADKTESLTSK